jgi:hypothetical protein
MWVSCQKVRRADAVVLFQAQQRGTVTPPVVHAQSVGLVVPQTQVLLDVVGHRAIEPPEHGTAGIVQGVVEVEQPDGVGHHPIAASHRVQCERIIVP